MISKITLDQTLPLRSSVLRRNIPYSECIFPTDQTDGIFHLGYFVGERLVCIATFFSEDYPGFSSGGFRLRGMATDPEFAGKGLGSALINFAINELTSKKASYIWCNARKAAVDFYKKLGFEIISPEFEVPGIGPHFDMHYQIEKV